MKNRHAPSCFDATRRHAPTAHSGLPDDSKISILPRALILAASAAAMLSHSSLAAPIAQVGAVDENWTTATRWSGGLKPSSVKLSGFKVSGVFGNDSAFVSGSLAAAGFVNVNRGSSLLSGGASGGTGDGASVRNGLSRRRTMRTMTSRAVLAPTLSTASTTAVFSPALASASSYWDASNASGLTSGNATWDVGSTMVWATSSAPGTTAPGVWADGNDAIYMIAAASTATVSGTVNPNSLQVIQADGTLGSTGGNSTFTIAGGTVLLGTGGITTSAGSGLTQNSTNTIRLSGSQTWSLSGLVGTSIAFNGPITDAGTSTLTLLNNTTVAGKFATFGATGSISVSSLVLGGGSSNGTYNFNGPVVLGGSLTVGSNVNGANFNSTISVAGTTTVGGPLTLSNQTNSFTGAINLNSNALSAPSLASIGGAGGGVLNFNGGSISITSSAFTDFSTRTLQFNTGKTVGINVNPVGANFSYDPSGEATTTGALTVGVAGTSYGTLTVTAANPSTTGATIAGGSVIFNVANADGGKSTLINGAGAMVVSGEYTTLAAILPKVVSTSAGAVALAGNSGEDVSFSGFNSLMLGAYTNSVYTGTITPGTTGYHLGGSKGVLTLPNTNALTGANAVSIGATSSSGTVALTAANNFTGLTTVANSSTALSIGNLGALGSTSGLVFSGSGSLDSTVAGTLSNATPLPVTLNSYLNFLGTSSLDLGAGAVTLTPATVAVNVAANSLTLGGVMTGASKTFNVFGNGTLVLGGANASSLTGGTINLGTFGSSGNPTGNLKTVSAGALGTQAIAFGGGNLILASGVATTSANAISSGGQNSPWSGSITLDAPSPQAGYTQTFGNFAFGQQGTMTFKQTSNLTSQGTIAIGAITYGVTASNKSQFLVPVGVSLSIASISAVTNSSTVTDTIVLDGLSTGNVVTGAIADTTSEKGNLTKSNLSAWTLQGVNTYAGNTVINGGTLEFANTGATTTLAQTLAGSLTLAGPDVVLKSTGASTGSLSTTFGSLVARSASNTANIVMSTGGAANKIAFTTAPTANALIDRGLFFNGVDYAAYDSTNGLRAYNYASDTNAVDIVLAADSTTLPGASTTSNVQLSGGSFGVSLGVNQGLNTLKIVGSHSISDSSQFQANGFLETGGISTISGAGGFKPNGTSAEVVVRVDGASDQLTISSNLSANSTNILTKSGAGTLVISGTNSLTGAVNINGGTLSVGANYNLGAVGTGAQININNSILKATGTFTTDNIGLNSRAVALTGSAGIAVTSGNTLTVSGVVSGAGNLEKTDEGTLTLTGSSSYTGLTTVTAGTLVVSGSLGGTATLSTAAIGTLEVDGALLKAGNTITSAGTVQGTGSVGAVSVSSGGTLAPGLTVANSASAVGTLTTTGAVTFADGTAKLSIRLGETTANDADQLLVSGAKTVSLNGATLNLTLGANYAHTDGQLFDIINNATGTTSGSFANGSVITASYGAGLTETFNILTGVNSLGVAGTGAGFNDVVLQAQAVPEPSTWVMLVGGFGLLIGYRRISRRSPRIH